MPGLLAKLIKESTEKTSIFYATIVLLLEQVFEVKINRLWRGVGGGELVHGGRFLY